MRPFITVLCVAGVAGAASAQHTVELGTLHVTDAPTPVDMGGATIPPGEYTSYSVRADWEAGAGNAWSIEATWMMGDADLSVIHANPYASPDALRNDDPVTLTWTGSMVTRTVNVETGIWASGANYHGGDPLYLFPHQDFWGSSATWRNVTVTLGFEPPPPLPRTFSEAWASGTTATGAWWVRPNADATALQSNGPVQFETVAFSVTESGEYEIASITPEHDGYLHIYHGAFDPDDQLAGFIAGADNGWLLDDGSSVVYGIGLETGETYIAVVSAFSAAAGAGPFTMNALGPGETVGPTCRPDLDADGAVDADDFFLFLQLFASADPRADFTNDGVIDADDFFAFLSAFAAGC